MRGALVGMNRAAGFVSRREDFTQGWKDGSGRGNGGLTLYGAFCACVCMFVLHGGQRTRFKGEDRGAEAVQHPSPPREYLLSTISTLCLYFNTYPCV